MRPLVPAPQTVGGPTGPAATRTTRDDPSTPAFGSFFAAIGDWLAGRLETARQRDVEAYLAESSDVHELEQRIRRLERGAFFSRYY